jgi:hypothetical protein
MYNINSLNNTLQVNGENKYIPNGNYSVKTFKTILLTLLPAGTAITYNDAQNTYTFTGTGTLKPITMGDLIGLTNNIEVSINNLTTGLINLSAYSEKKKNQCPREGMFRGSFARARGRDEG